MHPKLILTMNQAFCYEPVWILRRFWCFAPSFHICFIQFGVMCAGLYHIKLIWFFIPISIIWTSITRKKMYN